MTVAMIPSQVKVQCAPDEAVDRLRLENPHRYAPTLSFNLVRSLQATLESSSATMTVESAVLRAGKSRTGVHDSQGAKIALGTADSNSVQMHQLVAEDGATETSIGSAGADQVSLGGEDVIPSLLDRNSEAKGIAIAIILTLAGALLGMALARRGTS